jgi:UDP-4-amino-4-deoxy-L-arabinose formyltransferase/UDP-glucuronic acid dehydrogenase (UDP-4-keto-hexauronic acid decarboxylating)
MFSITPHDDIRTAQYKNMICSKNLIRRLLTAYQNDAIAIRTESKDFDSWYEKRTAADGKIDFHNRTRDIYNLIRGVAAPFPGAYAMLGGEKVTVWQAHPFDEMIDFSAYAPGEVIDIFDGKPILRTVDGSLLIDKYESQTKLQVGDVLV